MAYNVILYRAEGTIENPTILGVHKDICKFEKFEDADFAFRQEVKLSTKNGADIEMSDGDAYWVDGSNRIEYVMKIEEL